eukprot:2235637-Alexandrium_andersonii.AAC.1
MIGKGLLALCSGERNLQPSKGPRRVGCAQLDDQRDKNREVVRLDVRPHIGGDISDSSMPPPAHQDMVEFGIMLCCDA